MPFVRTALMATAACLIGAAAFAQTSTANQAPPAGASQPMTQPAPDNAAPPAASPDTSAAPSTDATMPSSPTAQAPASSGAMNAAPDTSAPVGTPANTSTTVDASGNQVIASAPVPDTKANRAAYGAPLSRAGKRTAPAGN
jgi:hypothetical protein